MENQLRICMVAFLFSPIVGGAETRAEKQARQLRELGHEVMIITLRYQRDWKKQEDMDGLPVTRIGGLYSPNGTLRIGRFGHLPIDLLMFMKLWSLRQHYDVLHSLQLSPLAGVSCLIGKLLGKPVVVSIPSTGPGKKQAAEDAKLMADTLADKLSDLSFLKVPFDDVVVGDLGFMKQTAIGGGAILQFLKKSEAFYHILSIRSRSYLTSNGFRADKIVRIPNGINITKFHPDFKKRPDPTKSERDILCVARLSFPKGIDVLLHAWYRMMSEPAEWRSHLKPRLLIAGSGELQEQMERICRELEIEDSVVFLGLIKNVVPLLQEAWGFVLPSRWEGMPNALLEAMACEVPCISTRVSGSEDIVEDGVNGLLVEPEQPAALAQAMRRLIGDTNLAQGLAQKGLEAVIRDYQLIRITEQTLDLYYRALGRENPVAPMVLEGVGEK
ncbi:MAG: glycosyltransferase family 4 protein [Ktedonobacteraceae bacterium]